MDEMIDGSHAVDTYIAGFPPEVQARLREVRSTIHAAAPDARETIKYRMPTFDLNGSLVHFAALKGAIGFYPTSGGIAAFKDELAPYISTPGAARFPLDQPLPLDLITRIVRFRVEEQRNRPTPKSRKRSS